jgi:hypothetical protein
MVDNFSKIKKIIRPIIKRYHNIGIIADTQQSVYNFKVDLENVLNKFFIRLVKKHPPKSIMLDFADENSATVFITIFNSGHDGGRFAYTDKFVTIELNLMFDTVDDIFNGELGMHDAVFHISNMFLHEMTHYLQIRNRDLTNEFNNGHDNFSFDKPKMKGSHFQRYLSTDLERVAYAQDTAVELLHCFYGDRKYIKDNLKTTVGLRQLAKASQTLKLFYNRIRKSKQQKSINIWQGYLGKVYKILESRK